MTVIVRGEIEIDDVMLAKEIGQRLFDEGDFIYPVEVGVDFDDRSIGATIARWVITCHFVQGPRVVTELIVLWRYLEELPTPGLESAFRSVVNKTLKQFRIAKEAY